MDKPRLIAVLVKLQSMFPKHLDEHSYQGYYESLDDYKIEHIESAGRKFMKSMEKFPLPVHFREELSSTIPIENTNVVRITPQQYAAWENKIANTKGSWFASQKKKRSV